MSKLRSIELRLPGAEAAAAFLTNHWGMATAEREGDTWRLRGAGDDIYLLALTEAAESSVQSVTFTASEADIDRIEVQAAGAGAPVERIDVSDEPGEGRGIQVTAPDGERFRFLSGVQKRERLADRPDMPNRLTHVVFNARDAEASGDFVERALGFRVSGHAVTLGLRLYQRVGAEPVRQPIRHPGFRPALLSGRHLRGAGRPRHCADLGLAGPLSDRRIEHSGGFGGSRHAA